MKTVQIRDSDYRLLELLGSDMWMSVKGCPPLTLDEVLHRIIEAEYERAKDFIVGN